MPGLDDNMNDELENAIDRSNLWQETAESAGELVSYMVQLIRVCVQAGIAPPTHEPDGFAELMQTYLRRVEAAYGGDAMKAGEWLRTRDSNGQGNAYHNDDLRLNDLLEAREEVDNG